MKIEFSVVQSDSEVSKRYTAELAQFTIGRSPECDIVLEDGGVSGHHSTIATSGDSGSVLLIDENSSNGTFVNGNEIVLPEALAQGDVVTFGVGGPSLKFWELSNDPLPQAARQPSETRAIVLQLQEEKRRWNRMTIATACALVAMLLAGLFFLNTMIRDTSRQLSHETQQVAHGLEATDQVVRDNRQRIGQNVARIDANRQEIANTNEQLELTRAQIAEMDRELEETRGMVVGNMEDIAANAELLKKLEKALQDMQQPDKQLVEDDVDRNRIYDAMVGLPVTIVCLNGNTFIDYLMVRVIRSKGQVSHLQISGTTRHWDGSRHWHNRPIGLKYIQDLRVDGKRLDLKSGKWRSSSDEVKQIYRPAQERKDDLIVELRDGYKFRSRLRVIDYRRQSFTVSVTTNNQAKDINIPFLDVDHIQLGEQVVAFDTFGRPIDPEIEGMTLHDRQERKPRQRPRRRQDCISGYEVLEKLATIAEAVSDLKDVYDDMKDEDG